MFTNVCTYHQVSVVVYFPRTDNNFAVEITKKAVTIGNSPNSSRDLEDVGAYQSHGIVNVSKRGDHHLGHIGFVVN